MKARRAGWNTPKISAQQTAKPRWYQRIGVIRSALQTFGSDYINRIAIEAVFEVPRRTAGRLVARIAADRGIATTPTEETVLPTHEVLAWLSRIENGEDFATERRRRAAVAGRLRAIKNDMLDARRAELQQQRDDEAAQLRFRVPVAAVTRPSLELLDGVRVEPGKVTFTFDDPAKAYPMFFAFAKAVGANYAAFEAAASLEVEALAERLRSGKSI